jgi:hypothetical protein
VNFIRILSTRLGLSDHWNDRVYYVAAGDICMTSEVFILLFTLGWTHIFWLREGVRREVQVLWKSGWNSSFVCARGFLCAACGSIVVKTLCYKTEGRGVRDSMRWIFSIYVILPATVDSGAHSASNRNEYQKQKRIMFLGSKVRPVSRNDNLSTIC